MIGNNYIGLLLEFHNLSSVVLNRQDQNGSKFRRSVNYRHVLHILLPRRNTLQKEEFQAFEKVPSAPNVSFVNYLSHLVYADCFCGLLVLSVAQVRQLNGSYLLLFSFRGIETESTVACNVKRCSSSGWAVMPVLNRAGRDERKSRSR